MNGVIPFPNPRNRERKTKSINLSDAEMIELLTEYNLIRLKQSKLSSRDRNKIDYMVLTLIKEKKLVLSKPETK